MVLIDALIMLYLMKNDLNTRALDLQTSLILNMNELLRKLLQFNHQSLYYDLDYDLQSLPKPK